MIGNALNPWLKADIIEAGLLVNKINFSFYLLFTSTSRFSTLWLISSKWMYWYLCSKNLKKNFGPLIFLSFLTPYGLLERLSIWSIFGLLSFNSSPLAI